MIIAVLAAVCVVLGGVAVLYNRLVSGRNTVEESWSSIDVQLKRRNDLVPSLVNAVKGYMGHEKSTLTEVTEARVRSMQASQAGPAALAQAEGFMQQALGRLFAVAEHYPDLKASANFLQLQNELAHLEDEIQLARRYYNAAVRDQNNRIQQVPSNFVAALFHFQKHEFFEIRDASQRAVPQFNI